MAVTLVAFVMVGIGIAELARQNSSHLLLHVTRPQRRTDGDEVVARAARVPRRGRTCHQQRHPGRAAAGGVLRRVLPARRSVWAFQSIEGDRSFRPGPAHPRLRDVLDSTARELNAPLTLTLSPDGEMGFASLHVGAAVRCRPVRGRRIWRRRCGEHRRRDDERRDRGDGHHQCNRHLTKGLLTGRRSHSRRDLMGQEVDLMAAQRVMLGGRTRTN